jgi:sodium transport system ATP-binding protein
VLVATDLVRGFDDPARGRVLAVDGVSLRVSPGEVFGLLGPNGAGKTTTLRLLATLLVPDRGTVGIDGIDARSDPLGARSKLGYVPAEAGLPRRLTALEAVTMFARIQGVRSADERARKLLDTLGASSFQKSACGSLSTGMKRRVVLARALVHDPPVLLLDEPTDGLDVPGRREVLRLVRELAGEGRAILLCSHIMGEVEQVCDRAAVLARGRIAAEGTLDELRARTASHDLGDAFVHLVDGTPEGTAR